MHEFRIACGGRLGTHVIGGKAAKNACSVSLFCFRIGNQQRAPRKSPNNSNHQDESFPLFCTCILLYPHQPRYLSFQLPQQQSSSWPSSMIDPIASLFMRQYDQATQNDISSFISVEEAIDCRDSNSRFFSLLNHETKLNIIINDNSTITSCKLDGHEIVVDKSLYNETHETWAIGDRPYQKLSSLPWNSHVRGSELILSTSTTNASNAPHTSLYFEMTRSNELNCIAKLKTIHLQHQVFYFNLNKATTPKARQPIDGHTIVIKCNGNMNRIQAQPTKLLCHCNKAATILPQSLIGDIPFELVQHADNPNSDDIILCDSIFSLESNCNLDYLQAKLQFQNRELEFEVRSVKSITASSNNNNINTSSNNNNNNVSSSSHPLFKSFPADLKQFSANFGGESSSGWTRNDDSIASSSSAQAMPALKQESLDPTTSSEPPKNSSNRSPSIASTTHPITMLRIRVRVTNFGVCIVPYMMINYTCTYRFNW